MSSAGLPKAWRGLNAGSYTPPPLLVCLQPRLLKPSSAYARFYQAGPLRQPRRPPSALSPFAQLGCYPHWGDVARLLRGRYPSVVAHTGSCATPVELSLPSAFSLVPRVLAGCTQSLLHGSFPTLSLKVLSWMLDPVPRRHAVCSRLFLRFFHGIIGLPQKVNGS